MRKELRDKKNELIIAKNKVEALKVEIEELEPTLKEMFDVINDLRIPIFSLLDGMKEVVYFLESSFASSYIYVIDVASIIMELQDDIKLLKEGIEK